MKSLQRFLVLGLMVAVLATATPVRASSDAEELAELYALLAQLQAQLAALQSGGGVTGAPVPTDRADVNITTGTASREDNNAVELSGEIDFDGESRAKVWFEYGTTYALSYSTVSLSLSRSGSDERDFEIVADDIDTNKTYYYRAVAEDADGDYAEGVVRTFKLTGSYTNDDDDDDDDDDNDDRDDEDYPEVTTEDADDITENSAELNGEVDMNEYNNGYVFLLYGEDEEMIEDATNESEYDAIDTDGDDLRKVVVDSDLDSDQEYTVTITGLDDDTEFFYTMCVEFEDEDDEEMIICGDIEDFETDN